MQPLRGIVVAAVEQAVAAPICTRHLGDLGARVVKVENRVGGDFARDYDDVVNGMSAYFAWANRNKESVALDLKHPLGQEALARLVRRADVVVQNLAPGAATRLGLDPAELRASRPELITVDISGFGQGGPYAQGRAYDLLIQAEAGSCAITGTPGQPAKPGIPLADIGAGMYALSSILAALFVRERTGQGTAISVGLFDSVAEWMGYALNLARYGGFDLEPNGVSSPAVAPYGAYPTADRQTLVLGTTNDREWRRLALDVLRRPDLADDLRYVHNRDRVAHRAELDAVIGEWAAGLSLAECRKAAEAAGLGHARLNRPTEVLSHPQLAERARWQEIGSPVGPVLGLLPPPESADWDWRLDPIPALGEHTEPVLRELGFSTGDLAVMRAEDVIGNRSRKLDMPRSAPKRALLSWLLRRLGPPPPTPRGHFSKGWSYGARHRAVTGHGPRDATAEPARPGAPPPSASGISGPQEERMVSELATGWRGSAVPLPSAAELACMATWSCRSGHRALPRRCDIAVVRATTM